MDTSFDSWGLLRKLDWQDVLLIVSVLLVSHLLIVAVQWLLRRAAEKCAPRWRLAILRVVPITRLLIRMAAIVAVTSLVIEPTFREVVAIVASVAIAVAFAIKDYVNCLIAGLVTVLENTYQPGDWIEVDGTYGEVKSIGPRAVNIVTPDDTMVIIPHSRIWSASIFNASSGSRSLLCVTDFYLHPDHDGMAVRQRLTEIAETSTFRQPETAVTVIVLEKPWGTHYRVKAYAKESREQFLMMTDLTVRGKESLREAGVAFAQAPYAEIGPR